MSAILDYIRSHSANGAEIAYALRLPQQQVYAELVRLDALGLIRARVFLGVRRRLEWEAVE